MTDGTPDDRAEQAQTRAIAALVKRERLARNWTLAELAARSGVSVAMISKVERAVASPTAVLLGRLSGAFGLSLSTLLARSESAAERVSRADSQPLWRDPDTGYLRRHVSPASCRDTDLVRVELPPGARVDYPADAYTFCRHLIWVLEGCLTFVEGEERHRLGAGDCLHLGAAQPCSYRNEDKAVCRYLVVQMR